LILGSYEVIAVVVASSPPLRSQQGFARSTAKSLPLNILPVSIFTFKILRWVEQRYVNKLKDLAAHPTGTPIQTSQNPAL